MIGTWLAGIPNLMALNSSPAIEVLRYRGLHALQTLGREFLLAYLLSPNFKVPTRKYSSVLAVSKSANTLILRTGKQACWQLAVFKKCLPALGIPVSPLALGIPGYLLWALKSANR